MKGICIDAGSTTVLQNNQTYFLFEHGSHNYYVSKFDNINAHCGSFQKNYFKLIDSENSSKLVTNEEQTADAEQYEEFVEEYKKYGIDIDAQYRNEEHPGEIIGDYVYYSSANPDQEPVIVPIQRKRFVAVVNKWRNGYNIGDQFIISEKGENGYFHVYLMDQPNKGAVGSYVTNFFKVIGSYEETENVIVEKPPKTAQIKSIASISINTLEQPKTKQNEPNGKPKSDKKEKGVLDGQTSIFDFL